MTTTRLALAGAICRIFPPIVAQPIRNYIFPIKMAREQKRPFSKKTITGSYFSGNTLDYHGYRVAVHGFFEWRNVIIANFFLKNTTGDIIEIGANIGTETISYCDILKKKGNVHAFEPLPQNLSHLEAIRKNAKNLILYPNAISDREQVVQFQVPPSMDSGTGKIITADTAGKDDVLTDVLSAPLDNFLDQFRDVKFMSIDTEGHEPFVLAGSVKTIATHQPAIVIEVSPKLLKKYASASNKDIFDFFTHNGYACYKIDSFSLPEIDAAALSDTSSHNWLCIPQQSKGVIKALSRVLFLRAIVPWYLLKKIPGN